MLLMKINYKIWTLFASYSRLVCISNSIFVVGSSFIWLSLLGLAMLWETHTFIYTLTIFKTCHSAIIIALEIIV